MTSNKTFAVIDTVSPVATFGIYKGSQAIYFTSISFPKRMLGELGSFLDRTFARTPRLVENLDMVCVAVGPGSFSGSRIGVACAKALSFSLDAEIIGFDHQEALLHRASTLAYAKSKFFILTDARRGQAHILSSQYLENETLLLGTKSATVDISQAIQLVQNTSGDAIIVGDLAREIYASLDSRPGITLGDSFLNLLDPSMLGLYLEELDRQSVAGDVREIFVRYSRPYEARANFEKAFNAPELNE